MNWEIKTDIPKYTEIMLPMLQHLSKQKYLSYKKMNEHVITLFKLTSKDIAQLTPKGNKRILDSRIQWARFYLTKSGMIKNSKKKSTITTQGVNFLKKHPTFFNKITLLEIPQFSEYMQETNLKAQKNYQKKHKVS